MVKVTVLGQEIFRPISVGGQTVPFKKSNVTLNRANFGLPTEMLCTKANRTGSDVRSVAGENKKSSERASSLFRWRE